MASIQDILKAYRLSYSGSGKVERVERIDATNGGHISDAGKAVLPWHTYVDKTLPDDVLKQVTDVRAALKALDPALPGASSTAHFITTYCKGRSLFFAEQHHAPIMTTLLADIDVEVQSAKDALDGATTDGDKAWRRKEYLQTLAFRHLMNQREGPVTAVNTYDTAVVTWGMGWAILFYLGRVLSTIYAIEKTVADADKHYVQKLLYLAGFLYDGGTYYVVDTDPAAKTVRATDAAGLKATLNPLPGVDPAANEALRVLHDAEELHIAWVLLGRDDLSRGTMMRAQLELFKDSTGNVPQAHRIQTAALYTFIAHLQHWKGVKLDVVDWATSFAARPARVTEPLPFGEGGRGAGDPGGAPPLQPVPSQERELRADAQVLGADDGRRCGGGGAHGVQPRLPRHDRRPGRQRAGRPPRRELRRQDLRSRAQGRLPRRPGAPCRGPRGPRDGPRPRPLVARGRRGRAERGARASRQARGAVELGLAGHALAMTRRAGMSPLMLAIGLTSCRGCDAPPPVSTPADAEPADSAAPPALDAPAPSVADSAAAEVHAELARPYRAPGAWSSPGAPDGTCDVEINRSVEHYHYPGWLPLWNNLAGAEPADPDHPDAGAPETDDAVRAQLHVGDCRPACVFVWPPVFMERSAYVVVPAPDGKLVVYTAVLNNPIGGQCGNAVGGRIVEEEPIHAALTAGENSSTRVCMNGAGKLVEESAGMKDEECQSACVTSAWRAFDLFVGPGEKVARVERSGLRGFNERREHISKLERKGDTLVVRGKGCTERFDLELDSDGGP
jgi:hypothetical protein